MERRFKTGIVGTDGKLLALLFEKMLAKTPAKIQQDYPDVVIYSREINDSKYFDIYEGSELMRKLEADFVVFPQIKISTKNLPNRTSLFISDLETLSQKNIDDWAKEILLAVNGHKELIPTSEQKTSFTAIREANHPTLHKDGFIALHGGMGPEAGAHLYKYVSDKFDGSKLLYSASSTMYETTRISELSKKLPMVFTSLDAEPQIISERKKIDLVGADVVEMACNTAHKYHPDLMRETSTNAVNIIEEGIKKIPEGGTALLLATAATVQSGLFQEAKEKLGRNDIKLIIPTAEIQEMVEDAIWNHLVLSDIKGGTDIMKAVTSHYENVIGKGGKYLAGCTEIILALENLVAPGCVIDSAEAAADKAIELAREAAKQRSISPYNDDKKAMQR